MKHFIIKDYVVSMSNYFLSEARKLGLWDVVFNQDIVPVLESAKRWEADHEEKAKLVRRDDWWQTLLIKNPNS